MTMTDWRYQYNVENDSRSDAERLKQWRSQGLALPDRRSSARAYVTVLVSLVFVAVVIAWSC